jgi:hypothetical protein
MPGVASKRRNSEILSGVIKSVICGIFWGKRKGGWRSAALSSLKDVLAKRANSNPHTVLYKLNDDFQQG